MKLRPATSLALLVLSGLPHAAVSQALATNLDEPNVTTYFVAGPANNENIYDINYSYPSTANPVISWKQVTGSNGRPSIAAGSSTASYVNTIYGAPEEFYLTPTAGGLHIEQLWGNQLSPADLRMDQHVHELWRWSDCSGGAQYDGWHNTDVTLANQNGSPPASFGPLTSFFDNTNGVGFDAVFFVDSGAHLHELYMSTYIAPINEWVHVDVTSQTGVAIGGHSPLASQLKRHPVDSSLESVYFLDASSKLWRVTSAPFVDGYVSWSALNLTAATGAIAAATGSPLAADIDSVICTGSPGGCGTAGTSNSRQEVYYIGTDQHVHMLGQQDPVGPNWFAMDLTAATGAPTATP